MLQKKLEELLKDKVSEVELIKGLAEENREKFSEVVKWCNMEPVNADIVEKIADGKTVKQVASELSLSEKYIRMTLRKCVTAITWGVMESMSVADRVLAKLPVTDVQAIRNCAGITRVNELVYIANGWLPVKHVDKEVRRHLIAALEEFDISVEHGKWMTSLKNDYPEKFMATNFMKLRCSLINRFNNGESWTGIQLLKKTAGPKRKNWDALATLAHYMGVETNVLSEALDTGEDSEKLRVAMYKLLADENDTHHGDEIASSLSVTAIKDICRKSPHGVTVTQLVFLANNWLYPDGFGKVISQTQLNKALLENGVDLEDKKWRQAYDFIYPEEHMEVPASRSVYMNPAYTRFDSYSPLTFNQLQKIVKHNPEKILMAIRNLSDATIARYAGLCQDMLFLNYKGLCAHRKHQKPENIMRDIDAVMMLVEQLEE